MHTPVAFMIFNRPDLTERAFAAIAQARPPKLLVVGDGPRPNHPEDVEKCAAARAIIDRVDWDCEVLTNYAPENLGVGRRGATGITWVFERVEEAIILEDDCLPHPTFFSYCEELLERYRHDERIACISGTNHLFGKKATPYSYNYFLHVRAVWGWATWRRAWRYYDYHTSLWHTIRAQGLLPSVFLEGKEEARIYENHYGPERTDYDGWDQQWFFACVTQHALTIVPGVNLVSNLGFRADAVHTINSEHRLANVPVSPMTFPLVCPPFVMRDASAEAITRRHEQPRRAFLLRALNRALLRFFPIEVARAVQESKRRLYRFTQGRRGS